MKEMSEAELENWIECVCKKLGQFCSFATPCGIPEVIEAIRKGDWGRVAVLVIQAGACAAAPLAIVGMLIAAAVVCTFGGNMTEEELSKALQAELERLDYSALQALQKGA